MPFSEKNAAALSRSCSLPTLKPSRLQAAVVGLAQHQRVMLMLLAAAQIDRVVVAILDMQPDGVFVKRAAGVEVGHVEHGVAGRGRC